MYAQEINQVIVPSSLEVFKQKTLYSSCINS